MKKHTKQSKTVQSQTLNRINPMVGGLDIGSSSVYACAGLANGKQEVREFSMFTADLKAMATWLKQHDNMDVAMESTGSYWIPVYDILDSVGIEVCVAPK